MNIAIIGYGKMGKELEKLIDKSKHKVCSIIDSEEEWIENKDELEKADVAIEFSTPETVISNIKQCFSLNLPIIVGTTGWNDKVEEIKSLCISQNQSLVWGANYSIGVNVFFSINKKLAELTSNFPEFDVEIEETHHTSKIDSPSGTAIKLANDILSVSTHKDVWVNEFDSKSNSLSILSRRISNTPGTHVVSYTSANESIEIKHIAFNRKSFAKGALLAAEWIIDKKGFYSVSEVFQF